MLDTNTLISAWIWVGNESRVVEKLEEGIFLAFTSPNILRELNRALHYPKFNPREEDIDAACSYYSLLLKPIRPSKSVQVIKDNPDDNKFLDCAIEAGAEIIVSGDRHLLDLGTFQGIRIVRSKTLLSSRKD